MVGPDDPRIARCGFCRLEGDGGLDFFAQRYEIALGRKSKSTHLDVVLGALLAFKQRRCFCSQAAFGACVLSPFPMNRLPFKANFNKSTQKHACSYCFCGLSCSALVEAALSPLPWNSKRRVSAALSCKAFWTLCKRTGQPSSAEDVLMCVCVCEQGKT